MLVLGLGLGLGLVSTTGSGFELLLGFELVSWLEFSMVCIRVSVGVGVRV